MEKLYPLLFAIKKIFKPQKMNKKVISHNKTFNFRLS